jgi:hypothetical protein
VLDGRLIVDSLLSQGEVTLSPDTSFPELQILTSGRWLIEIR